MSLFLTGLSGFVTTLAIAAGAFYLAEAKPAPEWQVGSKPSWTAGPAAAAARSAERVPASPSSRTSTAVKNAGEPPVDMITTGELPTQKSQDSSAAPVEATTTAHVQWCTEHYRSYRRDDNSYTAYSGGQRACVSPFSDTPDTRNSEPFDYEDPTADRTYAELGVGEEEPATRFNSRYIASCLARYRSYDPDDNSYQPYGGRSRRQCE